MGKDLIIRSGVHGSDRFTIVSKLVYIITYVQDLKAFYIGVIIIIHLLSTMDIPVVMSLHILEVMNREKDLS